MNFNVETLLYSDVLIPYQQKVYETQPNLNLVQSLKISSMMFFDEIDFNLNIDDDKILSEKVKDKLAVLFLERFFNNQIGFETEQQFKFKLSSVLHSHEDRYSQLFSLSFKKFLDGNVDFKKEYEKVGEAENKNVAKGDTTSTDNVKGKSNGEADSNANSSSNSKDNNFNRKLIDRSPADKLAITSNDGKGVINTASEINELLEKNENTQTGNTSQHKTDSTTYSSDSKGDSSFNSSGTENKKDKTNYNDRLQGYDFRNQSQGKVYLDYMNSLIDVYDIILNECDKCFLQIY